MAFSVRHFEPDDKLCQHIVLHLFEHIMPPSAIFQVLTRCHAWEQRERALNMPAVIAVILTLTLFPHRPPAGVLRQLAGAERLLWPDPTEPLPTDSALCQRCQQLGGTPVRHLFRQCCRPLASKATIGAFRLGRRLVAIDGRCEDVADEPANAAYFGRIAISPCQNDACASMRGG